MESNNPDIKAFYNHKFDFDNQNKETYDDWLYFFEMAIKGRAYNDCFIGLSSGYDSGAIYNELLKQDTSFRAFSFFNNEDEHTILCRLANIPNHRVLSLSSTQWKHYQEFLQDKIGEVALKDNASISTAVIFDLAKQEGLNTYISGQGGDEIISDYALFPGQSTFKGTFPDKLYEWPNFRESMQRQYITGLEEIAKAYNITIRYPFLDIDLVQEFLWLTPELKNRNYKAPLYEYLTKNKVPFVENVKKGFNPIKKR